MTCRLALGFAVLAIACGTALADKLILKDGRELRGEARRDGDTWTIVTTGGETLTFSKEEVKRHFFESRVPPVDAARMFQEFAALVDVALKAPTPEQYVWLREITNQANSYHYAEDSGRVYYRERHGYDVGPYSGQQGGGASRGTVEGSGGGTRRTETQTLRDKGIDGVFVDDWAQYTASFERLAADLRFKELTRRGKYTGSLYEFAMWPPAGLEAQGEAVRKAIEAVESSIELAQTTQRMVSALPTQHWKLQDEITRAQNAVDEARARLNDAEPRYKDDHRETVRERESRLRDKIAKMNREIPKQSTNAERRINDLARQLEVTRGAMIHAAKSTGAVLSDYAQAPTQPAGPESARTLPETVDEATMLILRHREKAKGLTTLGLDHLRAETDAAIHALFEGKSFQMGLYLEDTDRAESGGYELTAANRPENGGDPSIRAQLKFGDELRGQLVMCPKGKEIVLVARVQTVRLESPWTELEQDSATPRFVVFGTVQSVETICG